MLPPRVTFARNPRIVPCFTKLDSNTVDPRCYSYLLIQEAIEFSAYVCMYGHTYSKSMDQPGKVANAVRGHLISVCFLLVYSGQVRLGVPAGVSQEKVTQISHPPSFYDACLISREEVSSVPFPRRNLCTITVMFRMTPHHRGYITHTKGSSRPCNAEPEIFSRPFQPSKVPLDIPDHKGVTHCTSKLTKISLLTRPMASGRYV